MNALAQIKSRLHHNAYVCKDLEEIRAFYEDIIGYRLIATWAEEADLFGKVRTYAHCFFVWATVQHWLSSSLPMPTMPLNLVPIFSHRALGTWQ